LSKESTPTMDVVSTDNMAKIPDSLLPLINYTSNLEIRDQC
jgi:hypothetical protein